MTLDELIEQLQLLCNEHGGDLDVYYVGLKSPVNGAIVYDSSIGKVITLEGW